MDVAEAVATLRRGGIVAYPTETFYGLAVDALDEGALERLMILKGREAGKSIALIVSGPAMLEPLCAEIPPLAERLMAAHWPGPLTLVLSARPGLPSALVTDGGVAARQSSHPLAAALVSAWGGPITATSANRAGAPPAISAEEVRAAFPAEVGQGSLFVLDGGETAGGLPSTVVRVRDDHLQVLRQGAVAL